MKEFSKKLRILKKKTKTKDKKTAVKNTSGDKKPQGPKNPTTKVADDIDDFDDKHKRSKKSQIEDFTNHKKSIILY